MKKLGILALVLALVLAPSLAFALTVYDDGTKVGGETRRLNFINSTVASAANGQANVTPNNADTTGDLTFRTNLLANGRYGNGTLIMQSSSTPIGTTQLAYAVIQKRVGGAGGLDETDGGTRLDNGTSGQMITFVNILQESGGSWIITPDTATGFTTVTLDAAQESVTMLFVDSTVGWVIIGSGDSTVA